MLKTGTLLRGRSFRASSACSTGFTLSFALPLLIFGGTKCHGCHHGKSGNCGTTGQQFTQKSSSLRVDLFQSRLD